MSKLVLSGAIKIESLEFIRLDGAYEAPGIAASPGWLISLKTPSMPICFIKVQGEQFSGGLIPACQLFHPEVMKHTQALQNWGGGE